MSDLDKSRSFYLFDIDDNLLFLPTRLYLWNAERKEEKSIDSGEFARIQNELGRAGQWQAWSTRPDTYRDFRDRPGIPAEQQPFIADLVKAIDGAANWRGPSWPLLLHVAKNQRAIAMVTARGHEPTTIEGSW